MSMNLHCNRIRLWQTPTWITHMCTMNDQGKWSFSLKGVEAIGALHRYLEWASSLGRKSSSNDEEHKQMRSDIKEYQTHRNEVLEVITKERHRLHKRQFHEYQNDVLEVYVM